MNVQIVTGVFGMVNFVIGIFENSVRVSASDGRCWEHDVPNYGTSIGDIGRKPGFAVGWARFEDDMEVIYFYDKRDKFGYALNLDVDYFSEWGYAPF